MLLLYWVLYVTLLLFLLTPLNNLKDMASSGEAYGMEESSSSTPKISLLDHVNGFHYNALKKSDNFVIDMDAFSHGINKDSTNNANSRITVSFFFLFLIFEKARYWLCGQFNSTALSFSSIVVIFSLFLYFNS